MIEGKARLTDVKMDYPSGKYRITIEFDALDKNAIDNIQNNDLRVVIKKWRDRRTHDQNSYMWELYTKMAMVTGTSPQEIHEMMLHDYGIPYKDDDGYVVITIPSGKDISRIDGHWKFIKESSDGKFKSYLKLKGTSLYDTAEQAWYLDKVIEEARSLGIQTETPDRKADADRWLNQ